MCDGVVTAFRCERSGIFPLPEIASSPCCLAIVLISEILSSIWMCYSDECMQVVTWWLSYFREVVAANFLRLLCCWIRSWKYLSLRNTLKDKDRWTLLPPGGGLLAKCVLFFSFFSFFFFILQYYRSSHRATVQPDADKCSWKKVTKKCTHLKKCDAPPLLFVSAARCAYQQLWRNLLKN